MLEAWPWAFAIGVVLDLAREMVFPGVETFFSAGRTIRALAAAVLGTDPPVFPYLAGQAALESAALPLASVILIVEPFLWAGLAVLFLRLAVGRGKG